MLETQEMEEPQGRNTAEFCQPESSGKAAAARIYLMQERAFAWVVTRRELRASTSTLNLQNEQGCK